MKRNLVGILVIMILSIVLFETVGAQTASPSGQKTLAATLNVYVFPTEGQTSEQQSKDEAECYGWAVENTGNDPFNLAKQAEQQTAEAAKAKEQAKDAGKGAGAKGAVRGAAAGALIGGIAGDTGKGAAYGAAAGAIRGRRTRSKAQKSATQQAEEQEKQAKAATEEAMTNFRKAFSVCLEAKKYMVKY
ncbi:MAG: glycine zipper domain-containing protein [Acidobacteriota bacterium]